MYSARHIHKPAKNEKEKKTKKKECIPGYVANRVLLGVLSESEKYVESREYIDTRIAHTYPYILRFNKHNKTCVLLLPGVYHFYQQKYTPGRCRNTHTEATCHGLTASPLIRPTEKPTALTLCTICLCQYRAFICSFPFSDIVSWAKMIAETLNAKPSL